MYRNMVVTEVGKLEKELVDLACDLVKIDSQNPPGRYEEIVGYLEGKFKSWGIPAETHKVPEEFLEEQDVSYPKLNILASITGQEPGPTLIFLAHLDTVPVGKTRDWTYEPLAAQIHDGKIFGRGIVDCKGRLAAYAVAAAALKNSGMPFKGKLIVAATCDEETGGSLGAGYLVQQGLLRGEMAVVEGYSNQIIRAMCGVLEMKIIAKGKAAHAGWKWKGINAIEKMAKVIEILNELQGELLQEPSKIEGIPCTGINIGKIAGGTKSNVVPDYAEIEIDIRVMPEHTIEEISQRVHAKIKLLQEKDPEAEYIIEENKETSIPPTIIPLDSPLIASLQRAVHFVEGKNLPVLGVPIQSDARWLLDAGIQAINYGPGTPDNKVHGVNEYIEIDNLITSTKVLAAMAAELLVVT
ncbi:MAG: ArgE/DapE family deacylase [Bacillota bacterium]